MKRTALSRIWALILVAIPTAFTLAMLMALFVGIARRDGYINLMSTVESFAQFQASYGWWHSKLILFVWFFVLPTAGVFIAWRALHDSAVKIYLILNIALLWGFTYLSWGTHGEGVVGVVVLVCASIWLVFLIGHALAHRRQVQK